MVFDNICFNINGARTGTQYKQVTTIWTGRKVSLYDAEM